MNTTLNNMLTVREAARAIGVSHSQVTRYIAAGQLRARKISGVYLVAKSDARSFKRPRKGNPNFWKK